MQCTPYSNFNDIFWRNRKNTYSKIQVESQGTLTSQNNLKKKNKVGSLTLLRPSHFQQILQSNSNQDSSTGRKTDAPFVPQNKTDSPEINSWIHGHMIFNKDAKTPPGEKDSILNKWCWENWISACKRMKLDPYLISYIRTNSKWIKELNLRLYNTKFLEENTGRALFDSNKLQQYFFWIHFLE